MAELIQCKIHCRTCGEPTIVPTTQEQLDRYTSGAGLVQEIWPELGEDLRELIISKTCPKCWKEMFAPNVGVYKDFTYAICDSEQTIIIFRIEGVGSHTREKTLKFSVELEEKYPDMEIKMHEIENAPCLRCFASDNFDQNKSCPKCSYIKDLANDLREEL